MTAACSPAVALLLVLPLQSAFPDVASLDRSGGPPQYVLDGQRVVPLIFMGWGQGTPEQEEVYRQQVKMAADAGIHLQYTAITTPWPHAGEEPDFSGVDRAVQNTLDSDPQARVVVRYGVRPPQWWLDEHPDARHLAADGSVQWVWVGDEEWRREACRWQAALIRHLEERWGDRVVAYHPWAQHTGEWFYEGGYSKQPCFGPGVERSFRAWARQRYRSLARLSEAWQMEVGGWDQIAVPTEAERRDGRLGQFLDPARQRRIVDFFEFANFTMADAVRTICAGAKRACGGRKHVGVFYGYLYELAGWTSGAGITGHSGWRWLLDDPNIDHFFSPISYSDRELGGAGYFMAPVDSVAAHGKLWLNEDDTRTHLAPEGAGVRASGLEETRWLHQRNFMHLFPRRMGCWYMDLGATGWLADADVWSNIARLQGIWRRRLNDPPSFRPEIAVISDERSPLWMSLASQVSAALLRDLRYPLYRVGAPVGWWLLDDLLDGRVPPARLYIVQNALALTGRQRRQLLRAVQKEEVTVLWYYAPGYLDPERGTTGTAGIEELTGMKIEPATAAMADVVTPVEGARLCRGISEPFGSAQQALDPRFAVAPGPDVEAVAHYPNGQIAIAARGRSIFVGCLYTPPGFLRNAARRAGVHLYSEGDDIVSADQRFLGISPTRDGERVIRLPRPALIHDALTGRLEGEGTEITLSLRRGRPRLLLLEQQ